MKRFFLALAAVLCFCAAPCFAAVAYSADGISVNGYPYRCDVYYIDGNAYVKIRDFCEAVGCVSAEYDSNNCIISFISCEGYPSTGGEGLIDGNSSPSVEQYDIKVSINGTIVNDIPVYVIDGRTFLHLSALASHFNFPVANGNEVTVPNPPLTRAKMAQCGHDVVQGEWKFRS